VIQTDRVRARWGGLPVASRWLITLALLSVAVALWVSLVPERSHNVSPEALHDSVADNVGGNTLVGPHRCQKRGGQVWSCEVADAGGSANVTYRVVLRKRCWQARRVTPGDSVEGAMAIRARACVERSPLDGG
jgi:hypothetical protein